jgi:hypothetical protein
MHSTTAETAVHSTAEPATTEPAVHATATKSAGRFSTTKQSGWKKELCRDI